jgi:electron transfer flavoprotein alpha subunit
LTAAHHLSNDPASVAALVLGSGVQSLASGLSGWGADTVYTMDDPSLKDFNPLTWTSAIKQAMDDFGATCVVAAASLVARDTLPRLAARLDAAILTDLVDIQLTGGRLSGTKPMYAGKTLASVVASEGQFQIASIRPNVIKPVPCGVGSATAKALALQPVDTSRLRTVEIRKGTSARPDLTEASIIVSGGVSLGSADAFKIIHECADVLGAAVGASRAAVNENYASHDMQVGQTGKTVNPNLYIACGISGAIQHMAGMRTSKVIVAINKDKDAPIFTIANYGIVADLFEAVPALTKKLKELLG